MPHDLNSFVPRAVVFDMDGLMFNTEYLYDDVGGVLLARRGCEFTRELKLAMMGRPARSALAIMIRWHGLTDSPDELAEESEEIFRHILEARLEMMPGLEPLLAGLERAGIPKAIATSSGRAFVDKVLGRFALAPRFQFSLTCEDVVRGKPDPEIYLTAARRLGFAPAELLVLEDSHTGCRAAVEAGTFAVAVPNDHTRGLDFSGAKLILDSLEDERLYGVLGI